MKSAVISSKELFQNRIRAEQFLSPDLEIIRNVKNGKFPLSPVARIGKVRGGKRLPHNSRYVSDGVPYVRNTDIKDLRVDFENVAMISHEQQKKIARYPLKYHDVVIGIAGTIGNVGLVDEKTEVCQFNENLARITEVEIDPYYLAVYLASSFGQAQINFLKGGAVQHKLSLESINRIVVSLPPAELQSHIAQVVQEAYAERRKKLEEAEKLFIEIQPMVLARLGITQTDNIPPKRFVKSIREIAGGRFDFEAVAATMPMDFGMAKATPLNQVATQILERILPVRDCPNEDVNYISLGNIAPNTGELVDFTPMKGSQVLSSATKFKKCDILFGRMRPYLNKVWVAEFDGICTGEAVVLRPYLTRVDTTFLHALLMSRITLEQVVPFQSGTSLPRVAPSYIMQVKLPIPDAIGLQKELSLEIHNRRAQAKQLRAEAEQVVSEAKARVEKMILGEVEP